ncbi:MAG: hypothetical protein KBC02_04305 [Candidatus Pacebacteria bacterium]|nr:hypothetical protein [Candidatus Paceibacterota bacterium]
MPKDIFRIITMLFVVSVVGLLVGCGGGGTVGPSPTPTPVQSPQPQLQKTEPFSVSVGTIGTAAVSPFNATAGTYRFVAKWSPAPPDGQIYLAIIRSGSDAITCQNNVATCALVLAHDVSGSMPKEVTVHLAAQERVYWWTRPIAGSVSGTIDVWFTPDS